MLIIFMLIIANLYQLKLKFISIVDNVSVFQLLPDPFYTAENLPRVDGL